MFPGHVVQINSYAIARREKELLWWRVCVHYIGGANCSFYSWVHGHTKLILGCHGTCSYIPQAIVAIVMTVLYKLPYMMHAQTLCTHARACSTWYYNSQGPASFEQSIPYLCTRTQAPKWHKHLVTTTGSLPPSSVLIPTPSLSPVGSSMSASGTSPGRSSSAREGSVRRPWGHRCKLCSPWHSHL